MKKCIKETNEEFIKAATEVTGWAKTYWMSVVGGLAILAEFIIIVEWLEAVYPNPGPAFGFTVALGVIIIIAIQAMYVITLHNKCHDQEPEQNPLDDTTNDLTDEEPK